jgi:ribosome-associated protein
LSTQGFALGEAIKLNLGQRFFGQSLNLVSLALIKVQDGLNFLGFVKDLVKENAKAEPEAKAEPAAKVKSAKKAEPESDLKASSYSAFEPKSRKKPRQSLINPELVKPSGRELADLVRRAALEHKVSSPVLLDLTGLSSVADWFFIASADNSRQIQAAAEKIVLRSREAGIKPLGQEGLGRGETRWALIDLGDVVAHIFNHEARALYDLEGLWADAPRG